VRVMLRVWTHYVEESEIGRILQLKTEIPKSQNGRASHVHFEISGFRF